MYDLLSKVDSYLSKTILNARSCNLLVFSYVHRLWIIPLNGKYLKWDSTKPLKCALRFSKDKILDKRESALNFLLGLETNLDTWFTNFRLLSNFIKSLT